MNIERDLFPQHIDHYIDRARTSMSEYWPSSLPQAVSENVSHTVSIVKSHVSSSITATLNEADILVDSSLNQVEGISQNLIDQVLEAIAIRVQTWLDVHPIMAWMLHHPVLSIFGVLIIIFLIWSLLQTLLQLTQNLWAKILQLPLLFGMFVIRRIVAIIKPSSAALFRKRTSANQLEPQMPEFDQSQPQDADVIAMFIRLEELSREQNLILRELTSRLQYQITEERSPQT